MVTLLRVNGETIAQGGKTIRALCEENRANLRGANLRYAILRGANLEYANLEGASLTTANLRGANLRYAILRGASLENAILRGAKLENANLENANLEGADLRGAILRGANLRYAILRGASLAGADLRGANLTGATMLDGRSFEDYQSDHMAGICDDPIVRQRAIDAWGKHSWDDCPMHAAFSAKSLDDIAVEKRIAVGNWIALYDARLLPAP